MTTLFRILIATIISSLFAAAAPVGICLHAYSPEAPADKIECFEFEKFERVASDFRFFINENKPALVTGYRFRGTIPYKANLTPGNPEFDKLLKFYEETARATQSTRRYLNPKILAMRTQAIGYAEERQHAEALPKIIIAEKEYRSPRFKGIEDGKLVLIHQDGFVKIDVDKFSDPQLLNLAKLDPQASKIQVVEIAKNRIWNPHYEGISDGSVKIQHAKGILSLDIDSISDADIKKITLLDPKFGRNKIITIAGKKLWNPSFAGVSSEAVKINHEKGQLVLEIDSITEYDKKTIMSWSDGSWKVAKPGFYQPNVSDGSYGELVVESGNFYPDIKLENRVGESISAKTCGASVKLLISSLGKLPGVSNPDAARLDAWATEIVEERLERATPEVATEVIKSTEAKVINVTNVRARILQVLNEGVLASEFIGKLHTGTETVQTTKTVNVKHPLSEVTISKVVDTSTDDFELTEDVNDDLCFIVGNTSRLVDGEIVKIDSMRLLGRYQYTDVRGAQRSVRKYHVD